MLEAAVSEKHALPKMSDSRERRAPLTDRVTLDAFGRTVVNGWTSEHLAQIGEASNKHFQIAILPTEQCNFRCTYCYEDYRVGRMKPEIVSAIKRLLRQRVGDLETLTVSWFGGEPLLAKNIVLDVSAFAADLASQHVRLGYRGGMTTNGYFLDYETASALAECGVREYQISLDGPREVHNETRLRADGRGTYERIWANLLAIRNSSLPVSVLLRVHFSADTVQSLLPLLDDIKTQFLTDSRFSVAVMPIGRWGGVNDAAIQLLSKDKQEQAITTFLTALFGENVSSPQNLSRIDGYVCYASRSNALVIRPNGDVAKCTLALYDERNKVGTLQPDGTIQLIPGRLAPWLRGLETLDPKVLSCPLGGMSARPEALGAVADGNCAHGDNNNREAVPAKPQLVQINSSLATNP